MGEHFSDSEMEEDSRLDDITMVGIGVSVGELPSGQAFKQC